MTNKKIKKFVRIIGKKSTNKPELRYFMKEYEKGLFQTTYCNWSFDRNENFKSSVAFYFVDN